jgi:hypothetical protein
LFFPQFSSVSTFLVLSTLVAVATHLYNCLYKSITNIILTHLLNNFIGVLKKNPEMLKLLVLLKNFCWSISLLQTRCDSFNVCILIFPGYNNKNSAIQLKSDFWSFYKSKLVMRQITLKKRSSYIAKANITLKLNIIFTLRAASFFSSFFINKINTRGSALTWNANRSFLFHEFCISNINADLRNVCT